MIREQDFNKQVRERLDWLMIDKGMSRADIAAEINVSETTLRRLIACDGVACRRSIPAYKLFRLAKILRVPVSWLMPDSNESSSSDGGLWIPSVLAGYRQYPDALLEATAQMTNPIYTIISSFPSNAVLPDELVGYIYGHIFQFENTACLKYRQIAGLVNHEYQHFSNDKVPQILNYIPEVSMRRLISSDAIRIVSADVILKFLDNLERMARRSVPATIYLINEPLPRDLDTQLVVAGKITSKRTNRHPGILWSRDPEQMKKVESLADRVRKSRPREVDSAVIADFRKQVITNARRANPQ